MRRSTMITVTSTMIVLLLGAFASAQMMNIIGGMSDVEPKAMHTESDIMDKMKNMSSNCQMISKSFNSLESHFQIMMTMENMTELKMEMQKHYGLMSAMQKKLSEHQGMCGEMASMMELDGMHGQMIGEKSSRTSKPDIHKHNH